MIGLMLPGLDPGVLWRTFRWANLPPVAGMGLGLLGMRLPLLALILLAGYAVWIARRAYVRLRVRRVILIRVTFPIMLGTFLIVWSTLLAIGAGVMIHEGKWSLQLLKPFMGSFCAWGLAYFSQMDAARARLASTPRIQA